MIRRRDLAEYSVSELSGSIKRTVESAFDQVRVRGEISGYRGPHSVRSRLFFAEGRPGPHRRGDLERHILQTEIPPRRRNGSDRHRQGDNLSGLLEISDRHRDAGAGRRRCTDGSVGGAQAQARRRRPVRCRPQTSASFHAEGDRCRYLADRRGHPRYPAPHLGSFSRSASWSGR